MDYFASHAYPQREDEIYESLTDEHIPELTSRSVFFLCENNIDDEIRIQLLSYFLSLSQKLKDTNGKVEDIVDPDLCPYRSPPHKSHQNEPLHIKVRRLYQWLASTFLIENKERVRILSRIHNLPPKLSLAPIYHHISTIFESMLPSLKNFVNIRDSLQVCVRVRSYVLGPNETYEEPYYLDGETDHIVALGVYFLQVETGLDGMLHFSPEKTPQLFPKFEDYFSYFEEGKMNVFMNQIAYAVKLTNSSSLEQRATVLYLYIVDPLSSLPATKHLASTSTVNKVLTQWGQNFGGMLPKPIIKHIMSYIPYVWHNMLEAKRFRKTFRDSMKSVV